MLLEVFNWVISSIIKVFNLTRQLVLDSSSGITFFHFLVFIPFIFILYHLLGFIRDITFSTKEDESFINHERRYKK